MVGNSFAGLPEVSSFGKCTANIGARQDGRLRTPSVVDCAAERCAIKKAIAQVLTQAFRATFKSQVNPCGGGGAGARSVAIIDEWIGSGAALGSKNFMNFL